MVQGLGLGAFTAEGAGSVSGQGTKIPQAVRHSSWWVNSASLSEDSVSSFL